MKTSTINRNDYRLINRYDTLEPGTALIWRDQVDHSYTAWTVVTYVSPRRIDVGEHELRYKRDGSRPGQDFEPELFYPDGRRMRYDEFKRLSKIERKLYLERAQTEFNALKARVPQVYYNLEDLFAAINTGQITYDEYLSKVFSYGPACDQFYDLYHLYHMI